MRQQGGSRGASMLGAGRTMPGDEGEISASAIDYLAGGLGWRVHGHIQRECECAGI